MKRQLPAKHLIQYKPNILNLKEDVVTFKNLLQIAIAELSNKIDMIEIIDSLIFGD
jgi:hypothetical protein